MSDVGFAKAVIAEELEALLEEVAPAEVDSARAYVECPADFEDSSGEIVAGVPGGGVVELVGPMLVQWVLAIALEFLGELKKEGLRVAAKGILDWFTSLFRRVPKLPRTGKKAETVAAIAAALIKAGWDAGRAGRAAEQVWSKGRRAGERLAQG